MKRIVALFIFSTSILTAITAQDTLSCNPDTAFVNSGALVDPAPYINDTLGEGLPDGCINTPYDLTIFVNPPSTFEFNGFGVGVDSFTIDSLVNLPDGLSYTCSTGNCSFKAGQVSCIVLSGTPTDANLDTLYELKIHLKVHTTFLPIPVAFPDPTLAPGSYDLVLHPEGDPACSTVPTFDVQPTPEWITLFPNPVEDYLNVEISGQKSSIEDIRIWDQSGLLVKELTGHRGLDSRRYNLSDLPAGFYVTTIQTTDKVYQSKFIKQ